MKSFDNIIIGFGKGGKTLAAALAQAGQSVALIERDPAMYGGTCINVACIPTKSLERSARLSAAIGGDWADQAQRYAAAIARKNSLTAQLRQKNYTKLAAAGVDVITGLASFRDPHTVSVTYAGGAQELLQGQRFFLNTGSRPFIPPLPGLNESRFVYTSETLISRETLPRRLVIIGGGYIGLEFASYYANFGSQVVVIQDGAAFIPREDGEMAQAVLELLQQRGIEVLRKARVTSVVDDGDQALVSLETDAGRLQLAAEAVLVATGRRPNLAELNLEAAGVELTEQGAVRTDSGLRTSAPHIWALGDVTGGLQFTYISLDDFRIVQSQLLGDQRRTTANRGAVPYTVFLDPPLSRVGLSEEQAVGQGFQVKVARLAAAAIPKAQVLQKPAGLLKAIVHADSGLILGAHFFCAESQEMINLVKLCMDAGLPYTVLRDGVFNHPTMSEALNDLFAGI